MLLLPFLMFHSNFFCDRCHWHRLEILARLDTSGLGCDWGRRKKAGSQELGHVFLVQVFAHVVVSSCISFMFHNRGFILLVGYCLLHRFKSNKNNWVLCPERRVMVGGSNTWVFLRGKSAGRLLKNTSLSIIHYSFVYTLHATRICGVY